MDHVEFFWPSYLCWQASLPSGIDYQGQHSLTLFKDLDAKQCADFNVMAATGSIWGVGFPVKLQIWLHGAMKWKYVHIFFLEKGHSTKEDAGRWQLEFRIHVVSRRVTCVSRDERLNQPKNVSDWLEEETMIEIGDLVTLDHMITNLNWLLVIREGIT